MVNKIINKMVKFNNKNKIMIILNKMIKLS